MFLPKVQIVLGWSSTVGFVSNLLSKLSRNFRCRILCNNYSVKLVSELSRSNPSSDSRWPTFWWSTGCNFAKKNFKMPNVAAELIRCGILCVIHVWYLQNCMLRRQVWISLEPEEWNFGVTRCGFSQKSLTLHLLIKHSKINIWQNISGSTPK